MSSNILQFYVDEHGHAIIRYVGDQGERKTLDLTAHVEDLIFQGSGQRKTQEIHTDTARR